MTKEQSVKNLDEIITKIESARLKCNAHHIVSLVGISKYNTADDIKTLYLSGQRAFGENKVQDLKEKSSQLNDYPISWHFVGRLQTNKINQLIDLAPVLMHSLEDYDLANELDKRLKIKNKKMKCLLQINSAKEESKAGVMPEVAVETYKKIKQDFTNIELIGVMSIGAHSDDKELIKKSFITTKNIFDTLKNDGATICSMGMSSDYELAIELGSNMVRIGSSLFKD
ncbi:YggS family pyridoxal phosphate-dependent enzyme [Arcobacter sp. FWKO B]|uniref:YggS family pyridoxal phosphate-dependent enzyme n=1 Tax=Arcobacter sp. FWKO B TaxID=2593672 RepID=UPI0018A62C2F|nr:YggS family pyridoxal phosphate-dependent enzyme [Arcobacter sp. FWKO B]QOG13180.1 YggS family pyridoxal phosphate-dependent enzyme [Arcobacter sp. FWKO B]